MTLFDPSLQAAHARLAVVDAEAYARTRNALDGAVTRLSPYLTHGLLTLAEVHARVHARQPLDARHKLVFELGWRAYYRHVWAHLGDGIHQSLHAGLLPDAAYAQHMPDDVLEARTGIPVIDLAVRTLYETGYLHNHARMWLASYLVHLRRVHWHTGAQWMLGYLLDGDVASNHLSWQWVASTGSVKPYLFNADNVSKYAGSAWHSPGTVIDTSYEALDLLARAPAPVPTRFDARHAGEGMVQPALFVAPPAAVPPWQTSAEIALAIAGRAVWLHHPWAIGSAAHRAPEGAVHIGVGFDSCHHAMPWSAQRWDFVTHGLQAQTEHLCWGSVADIASALQQAQSVHWYADPHVDGALAGMQALLHKAHPQRPVGPVPLPCLFAPVDRHCRSFSEWWKRTQRVPDQVPPHA